MTQPPMNATDAGTGPIELQAHGFRLGVLPRLGASLTHLVWTPPGAAEGAEIDLMRRATPGDIASGNPSRLASFAMVPFTNRIDGGRISFEDERGARQTVQVPINRAAQNAAIHGFGRTAPAVLEFGLSPFPAWP